MHLPLVYLHVIYGFKVANMFEDMSFYDQLFLIYSAFGT